MRLLANNANGRFLETFSYVIRQNGCQFVFWCCCISQCNLQSAGIYHTTLDRSQGYLTNSTRRQLEGFFIDFTGQGSQTEFGDQLAYQLRSLNAVSTVRQFESNITGYVSENFGQSQTIVEELLGTLQVSCFRRSIQLDNGVLFMFGRCCRSTELQFFFGQCAGCFGVDEIEQKGFRCFVKV
ncbi:hypothetical protein OJ570_000266 [Escherichia coli]|nr:hypothetical protein [Escherichia coli]